MQGMIPLIARALLALIFLMSFWSKLNNFDGTTMYMANHGMPMPGLFLFGAMVLLLVGGLSVLLGYRARNGAWLLIVFLIPATLIFHTDFSAKIQTIMFMKNLAILGGLLMITAYGSGPFSLDDRK